MSIKSALAKLRGRDVKFSTLKAALEKNSLPKSNGWDNLEKRFAELHVPAMELASNAKKLERIYRDNVDWGDKAVQFAKFEKTEDALLSALVATTFKPGFVASEPCPSQVTSDELGDLTLQPALVRTETNDTRTGMTFYFYSRAYQTLKETFAVDDMKDAISLKRFAGFDQVVAYKQLIYQRIDTVYVDVRSRRIEFRVDATRFSNTDRMVDALRELKDAFRTVLYTQADAQWKLITFPLVNFFPKIEQMYNGGDGSLAQLGHNTAAGAINMGKMRGLKGDLKQDPSHVASMAASANEKFAIKKSYPYYNGLSAVHLSIPGKSADTGTADPTINMAIVEDCIDGKQFDDMMQILR
jgi:hypothetical protein